MLQSALRLRARHLLTGEELSREELDTLLDSAEELRRERGLGIPCKELTGKTLSLLFDKPSLRTRVSFTVAMQEAGGSVIECLSSARKHEEPEDVAQVLGGYCHAVMIRTHGHGIVERMASRSPVPVINGLSDLHHPCQILADLLTLKQAYGSLRGLEVTYVGDGNNILHSLLLLLPFAGIHLRYSCPGGYGPDPKIVETASRRALQGQGSLEHFTDPRDAARDAQAFYTDVWTSMGFEKEEKDRELAFSGFQLNEELYALGVSGALIMHCMPMVRGQEISEGLADHPAAAFYRQSENRLHVQKALLLGLLSQ